MKKVRFAVCGLGFIGKKHVECINNNPEAELIATIDIDPNKGPDFLSLEDFINSNVADKCDVLCVATPNFLHINQSILALKHRLNVICEKPLGLNIEECLLLQKAEDESGKKVICVLQNRYSPPIKWLKEIVSTKQLKEVFHIQINCYWNRDDRYYFPNGKKHDWKGVKEKDGGVLFTQFSHFVDILTWVFGEIHHVNHISSNFTHQEKTDFDDTGSITFKLENGAIGNFNYSTSVWNKNLESSIIVIGKNGSVKIGGQYMDHVEICDVESYTLPELQESEPPNDYGNYKGSAQNHKFVIQNAVDFILHNKDIDVNLQEGIKSVKNIIAMTNES